MTSSPRGTALRSPVLVLAAIAGVLALNAGPAAASRAGRFHGGGVGFGYAVEAGHDGDHAAFQYALIARGSNTTCSVDGGNSWRTIGELQREVERTGHEVMWFAVDDREYVIRDEKSVERAHAIVEPVTRLGREQGRLGSLQGELGRRQGEMGALQGRLGGIEGRLAGLESVDAPRYHAEIEELRTQVAELTAEMRGLAERQRALGVQQQELGRRQRELGEEQARASRLATSQLRDLADRAIGSGTAEPIDRD